MNPIMRVECGSIHWEGQAETTDQAIIAALTDLPDLVSVLLRVHDGRRWLYLDFRTALKIAGYSEEVILCKKSG